MFSAFLQRFASNERGVIKILFALALPLIVAMMALAVEVGNMNGAHRAVQTALDAATLAAARARVDDNAERNAIATQYFRENISQRFRPYVGAVTVTKPDDASFLGTTQITFPSMIGSWVGAGDMAVKRETYVKSSPDAELELALVLDTTFSMTGSRIATLKTAGKDLADIVMDGKQVKVAVVPFAKYVNIGTSNRNADGLDIEADIPDKKVCEMKDEWEKVNCKKVTKKCDKESCKDVTKTCYKDGTAYSCKKKECKKTGTYDCEKEECEWKKTGKKYESCKTEKGKKWKGCVGSREYPLNTEDSKPNKGIPSVWASCNTELLRLTTDVNAVKSRINGLTVKDETYMAPGLLWGWRAVSHRKPFPDGKDPSVHERVRKVIVLMSDGHNTKVKDNSGPKHDGGDSTKSNQYLKEVCDNVKDDDITVYTVAFEITNTTIKNLMKDCASDPSMYFEAKNSQQLKDSFAQIADELSLLVISR
jgi:Mg-chelatase subunit ChlD